MVKVKSAYFLNEIGSRTNNEDSIYPSKKAIPSQLVFLVCDGVGGAEGGEKASKIAANTIGSQLQEKILTNKEVNEEEIVKIVHYSEYLMGKEVLKNPELGKMATTLTLAVFEKNSIKIGWCGDSRIYHIRNGNVLFKSEDHSYVNFMVKMGQISREDALHHPRKNEILRSLSPNGQANLDIKVLDDIQTGDLILLCSDGFMERMTPKKVWELFLISKKSSIPLEEQIDEICNGHTRDNYSMWLIEVENRKGLFPIDFTSKKLLIVLAISMVIFGSVLGLLIGMNIFKTEPVQNKIEKVKPSPKEEISDPKNYQNEKADEQPNIKDKKLPNKIPGKPKIKKTSNSQKASENPKLPEKSASEQRVIKKKKYSNTPKKSVENETGSEKKK